VRRADNLTTFMGRLSRNSGASTSWNPKGLSRHVAGKLYLYLSLTSALDGGGWLTPRLGRFTPGNEPVPIVWGLGWPQCGFPDCPARRKSLYGLRYPGPDPSVKGVETLPLDRRVDGPQELIRMLCGGEKESPSLV
jgi:hypothetical protein